MKIELNGMKLSGTINGYEMNRKEDCDGFNEKGEGSFEFSLDSSVIEFDKSETAEVLGLIKELTCFGMQLHRENLADKKEDREFRKQKNERDFKIREQELDLRRHELDFKAKEVE